MDRLRGCFYGCAVGDALGAPLEFSLRDTLPLVTTMQPLIRFRLPAGSWTDDTSLMLCLAASMAARGGLYAFSELSHYYRWWDEGYLSVSGTCFDIGRTTTLALAHFDKTREGVAPTTDDGCCGNGSLMRIAPVPIFAFLRHGGNAETAWTLGAKSSTTTHAHPLCIEACGLFSALVTCALRGESKATLLERLAGFASHVTDARLVALCSAAFLTKSRDAISSSGFVLDTLEAALWAFFRTPTFAEGAVLAVNLADDADTVGAVYGTLAGAFYGVDAIPSEWLGTLQGRRMLDGVFADLVA